MTGKPAAFPRCALASLLPSSPRPRLAVCVLRSARASPACCCPNLPAPPASLRAPSNPILCSLTLACVAPLRWLLRSPAPPYLPARYATPLPPRTLFLLVYGPH